MSATDDSLQTLVTAVIAAAKYRSISPDLVRRIGARELAVRPNFKAAVKATRNKLHQVGGAYWASRPDYAGMLAQLRAAVGDPDQFRSVSRTLMSRHVSTRERLPILAEFYATTLAGLTDIRIVIDAACGLNPLAWPWMPFDSHVEYVAYDIYADLIDFIDAYLVLAGINGRAKVRDLLSRPPTEPADLALLFKSLPVLDQVEKGSAPRLLDALQARYLLITFPVHSLGGRGKGMAQNYEAQFLAWAEGRGWRIQRFEFPSELAFLVATDDGHPFERELPEPIRPGRPFQPIDNESNN